MEIVRGGQNNYLRCKHCGHSYFTKKELFVLSKDGKQELEKKTFYFCDKCGQGWESKYE